MGHGLLNRSVLDWPTGVTVYRPEKCFNGYTVVVPYRSELMFLIDMSGRVVHAWQSHPEERRQTAFLELLPNGNWIALNYLRLGRGDVQNPSMPLEARQARDMVTEVLEVDWDGNIVWNYAGLVGWLIHHDMARLMNGNTLILVESTRRAEKVSDRPVAENFFIEVAPDGEVLWQWNSCEHYDEFGFDQTARALIRKAGGDCFHTNTLEALPGNELGKKDPRFRKGNILSCQRNTNLIYIINKDTGEVVWRWGTGRGELVGPHHPTMLANGNILIYDNGGWGGYPGKHRFYSRLLEINPATEEVVYQYRHEPHAFKETSKFFSYSWGSVQRLPNGNTFSLDCHKGRLFEVTPQGEIVWEYISPFQWNRGTAMVEPGIYRAYRYAYGEVPDADPCFMQTDGHAGAPEGETVLLPNMGLPSHDLP